ncbi:hypothetical protein [Methanobrevibacter arboriphilus]|uniref:hypothetical protein n=1 Tax=Methanobrevibacter arboriphilus TaxID=39441 RepID=UPI001CDB1526|nr:hypothetical protein [Methanobrevibacter arboriphilus]
MVFIPNAPVTKLKTPPNTLAPAVINGHINDAAVPTDNNNPNTPTNVSIPLVRLPPVSSLKSMNP